MTTVHKHPQRTYDNGMGQLGGTSATLWDWRNVGGRNYITPPQDQGTCQASTAFAITDAMNARLRIQFYIALSDPNQVLVPSLSAADLFYCGGGTCDGGQDVEQALNYAMTKGVVPAYSIPYKPGGTCGRGSADLDARATKIAGFITQRRAPAMRDAIQSRGPIIATLRAYQDLKNYKSGVYRYDGKSPFLYMQTVSVIGFTTDGWLCKNSWGPSWGMGGVFCIAYGECGIDDEWMWEFSGFTNIYPYGTVTGTPAVSVNKGVMHIIYRDNYDQIQDLSAYPPSATQPVPLDGLAAINNPALSIDSTTNQPHVVRTDLMGNLQDNFLSNGWSEVQWLTGPQGLTKGPPAVGDQAIAGGPHVFYRDADGNIHHVYFQSGQWGWQQITGGSGIKAPPAAGDPKFGLFGSTVHVCYRDTDGNLQDLQKTGDKWTVKQLTGDGLTAPPTATGNPVLTVYNSWLRVIYRDRFGVLQHIYNDRTNWGWEPLPVQFVAVGDATLANLNGYLHIFYREYRGYIWDIFWYGRWVVQQITGPGSVSGGQLADGDPTAVVFGPELHVIYRDIDQNLSDAYWTGTTWTHLVRI